MSFCDYIRYAQGYQIRQSHEWARVRRLGLFVLSPYSEKQIKEENLFRLPTDIVKAKSETPKLTVEQYEALLKRYGKKLGTNGG